MSPRDRVDGAVLSPKGAQPADDYHSETFAIIDRRALAAVMGEVIDACGGYHSLVRAATAHEPDLW
jgi:hypothetical protein